MKSVLLHILLIISFVFYFHCLQPYQCRSMPRSYGHHIRLSKSYDEEKRKEKPKLWRPNDDKVEIYSQQSKKSSPLKSALPMRSSPLKYRRLSSRDYYHQHHHQHNSNFQYYWWIQKKKNPHFCGKENRCFFLNDNKKRKHSQTSESLCSVHLHETTCFVSLTTAKSCTQKSKLVCFCFCCCRLLRC